MNVFASTLISGLLIGPSILAGAETLELHSRFRQPVAEGSDAYALVAQTVNWDAKKTAIIICDMWDRHWCKSATARVAEMTPRMNAVLKAARARGVLIVHAPSDTMKFYADYPQRQRAQQAPLAAPPSTTNRWKLQPNVKEPPLPVVDSDGGCDDLPPCEGGSAWRSENPALEIMADDAISDNGAEIYNLFRQLGIENVIIMGVHTNMCVLGRSFAIRHMIGLGQKVLLMRDLTDTMYNPRQSPYVSHFAGTDLVVEHIEKYWCPTITSVDFLGGEPFRFQADRRQTIAFIIGENEYHTWVSVPEFANQDLARRGLQLVWVTSSTNTNDREFPNYQAIRNADLLFVSARRRTPRLEMIELIRQHLAAGKPLVGIRTASHAFGGTGDKRQVVNGIEYANWPEFDAEVLGGNYHGHLNAGWVTKLSLAPGAQSHPVLAGVAWQDFQTQSSLYENTPLKPGSQPLLIGTVLPG